MLTVIFIIYSAFLAWFVWQAWQLPQNSYLVLLLLVLVGLVYDNVIIATGRFMGAGQFLEQLSVGRFYIHALLTPTLMIFGVGMLRAAGVSWAQSKWVHGLVCLVTTLLIGLGAYFDIWLLELEPKISGDLLRYTHAGGVKIPPIPAIVTIIFLMAAGGVLWAKVGEKWLFIGSAVMFVAAALGMGEWFFVGNFGEVALSFGAVACAQFLANRPGKS